MEDWEKEFEEIEIPREIFIIDKKGEYPEIFWKYTRKIKSFIRQLLSQAKKDLIYKDRKFEIYKRDAGDLGTFIPLDCLEIIDISIKELANWDNAGFAHKEDYEKIVNEVCDSLKKTVKKKKEGDIDASSV